MTSNGFTLADPNDRGMLDVVGFDNHIQDLTKKHYIPLADQLCPFHATRNPGVSEGFTDFAAVVQLRLRVAIGLQTLTVKPRLLTGENSVRIRGDPPISMLP
jgi:hypothetical protein